MPVEIKDEERPVIKKEISIKIPAKATNRLIDTTELRIEESKYGVQLTKNESGCWVADIKDKSKGNHKTHSHSFTSKKTGDDGYHEAAAWVHAVLDHKFYIESEFQDDLNNIARGFGIAAGSLLLLENALDIAQRRLGGGVATGITMVSTGTDSFKKPVEGALAAQKAIEATNTSLQVTSTAFDIGGFFLSFRLY